MIVKVQIPLISTEEKPMALVYNESRTYQAFIDVDEGLLKKMEGQKKRFFHAKHSKDDLVIGNALKEQGW